MKKILIGVPCYNEEKNIDNFFKKLVESLDKIIKFKFEILFVDDGSKDKTWKKILEQKEKNYKYPIKSIRFSRNFGKEIAIRCMLERAEDYDYFITIDSDLQHPPSLIKSLIDKIYDDNHKKNIVLTRKTNKNSNILRLIFTKIFYFIFNIFSEFKLISGLSDFGIIDNSAIKIINNFKNNIFVYKTSLQSTGLPIHLIEFCIDERAYGSSNFNFFRLIGYAFQTIYSYNSPFIIKFNFINLFFVILLSIFLSIFSYIFLPHLLKNIFIFFIFLMIFWITVSIVTMTIYLVLLTKEIDRKPIYIVKEEF